MHLVSPLVIVTPLSAELSGRSWEGEVKGMLYKLYKRPAGLELAPACGCHPLQGPLTFPTLDRNILMQGGLKRPQTQQHKESRGVVSALVQEEKGTSMGPVTFVLHTGGQDYSLWCCMAAPVWQAGCDKTQTTLPSGTWPAKLSPTPCTFVAKSLFGTCVHSRQGL